MDKNDVQEGRPMLTFVQAVSTVFRKYATFTGRARRSEYWWFQLFQVIVVTIAALVDKLLGFDISDSGEGVVSMIVELALILPSLSVAWRRLHDTGRSGWYFFCVFIPAILCCVFALVQWYILTLFAVILILVMSVVLLVWYCMDSKPEENKYGPSPKYGAVPSDNAGDGIPEEKSDSSDSDSLQ